MANTNILLETGTNEVEVLELYLDEDTEGGVKRRSYGVNVAKVKKIFKEKDLKNFSSHKDYSGQSRKDVDTTSKLVLGLFEFMGGVVPLIDLAYWLQLDITDKGEKNVVVTEFNNVTNAFLVSGVNRIHRIGWDDIESLDANMLRYAGDTIIGMVKLTDPDRIMHILDLERAISDISPSAAIENDDEIEDLGVCQFTAVSADDSMSMRTAVRRALQKGGFRVSSHPNGREAWELLKDIKAKAKAEGKPVTDYAQILVTDIEMPQMDGHTLCRKVKEDPILKDLPVYLYSSLITEDLLHKGETVGANRQYSKPQIVQLVKDAQQDCLPLLPEEDQTCAKGEDRLRTGF